MFSKIVEMAFFGNVIIFYCFLELLKTPTVFFLKKLILGPCYTFVHQNCATDHSSPSSLDKFNLTKLYPYTTEYLAQFM